MQDPLSDHPSRRSNKEEFQMPPTNTGEDQTQDLQNAAPIVFDRDGPSNTIDALQDGTTRSAHTPKRKTKSQDRRKGCLKRATKKKSYSYASYYYLPRYHQPVKKSPIFPPFTTPPSCLAQPAHAITTAVALTDCRARAFGLCVSRRSVA